MRRLRLPKKLYGGALRSLVQVAPAAYVAGTIAAITCFMHRRRDDGCVEPGFKHEVGVWLMGEGACDEGKEGNRFQYLTEGSPATMGTHLKQLWTQLRGRADLQDDDEEVGPLHAPVKAAGTISGREIVKLQKAITEQLDNAEFSRIDAAMRRRPASDPFRKQWMSLNRYSTQFVASVPVSAGMTLSNTHLRIAFEMYFNMPYKAQKDLHVKHGGQLVRNGKATRWTNMGHALTSTAQKNLTDWRHDEMKWLLDRILSDAQIPHECEVRGLFTQVVRQGDRARQGLIPDFKCEYTHGIEVLQDVKCITMCKSNYTQARVHKRADAVNFYAHKVMGFYRTKARRADRDAGHPLGTMGPVEAKLAEFPCVDGLVFGAYGEASDDVEELVKQASRNEASIFWRQMGARSMEEARKVIVQRSRMNLGVAAVRSHARLKANRLREVVNGADGVAGRAAKERRARSKAAHKRRADAYYHHFRPDGGSSGEKMRTRMLE